MTGKHKILIPLDDSVFSRQIIPCIQEFLPPDANELILLRVGDRPEGHLGTPPRVAAPNSGVLVYETRQDVVAALHPIYSSQEIASAEAGFELETLEDVRRLRGLGYAVELAVRFDSDRAEAIVSFAEAHAVDLVAMTTHWRTGINKLIHGSVAQVVAGRVNVPVLIMRPSVG